MSARRILLVDDDPDIRRITALALERLGGFAVTVAADGADALDQALREPPDLVLLAVWMPGMDGPSTLAVLRSTEVTARIPVVFFTATAAEAERRRLVSLGALAIALKPFDLEGLLDQVRTIMAEIHHKEAS